MAKRTVNLLIETSPEARSIKLLKKAAPRFSVAVLTVFMIFYVLSVIYIQVNLKDYNQLQAQVNLLENKITGLKSTESVYISSLGVLEKIRKILASDSKVISNTLPAVVSLEKSSVRISTASIDNNGPVGITLNAPSSTALMEFITTLKSMEDSLGFSDIKASGIIREPDGGYNLTVTLLVRK